MNPRSYKKIVETFYKETHKNPDAAIDAFNFFWSQVRKDLISLRHPYINVIELGIFDAKVNAVYESAHSITKNLSRFEKYPNFTSYKKYQEKLEELEKLEALKKLIMAENARRTKIKKKRYAYLFGDLEQQKKNPGGD